MTEIGREILKNVYTTMKERNYSCLINPSRKVTEICISDTSNSNLCIYIATKKFNKVRQHDLTSIVPEVESLLTGKVVKDAILEIYMPVVSLNNEENGEAYVASAYAVVKYSSARSFGASPLKGEALLIKITSGLDNIIGLCIGEDHSKIALLHTVQEILYKKEDMLEYLI